MFSALASLAVAVVLFQLSWRWFHPAPEIPLPADLNQLQPQLRAYVLQVAERVQQAPRDAQTHAVLGIVYAANELWREARLCFANAARLDPEEPLGPLYVAVATQELGDQSEALRLLDEVAARFPGFPQGYDRLGTLALRLGDLEKARTAFQRLVDLAPAEWRGYAGLGEVELRLNHPQQAATFLERAIQLDPDASNAHSLLGLAYRGLGRQEDAQFELSRGLGSQNYPMPDRWGETAHQHMRLTQDQLEMANRYSLEGAHERAIDILATALTFDPTNLALMNGLAMALNRAGQPTQAQVVLNKLFELDAQHLAATITASFVAHSLGQTQRALGFADQAVALAPSIAQAHLAKANALLAMERDLEALESLQTASRCDPQNPEIYLQMGDVELLNLDRTKAAFEHYRTACELRPTLVSAQIRLAQMQIEQGDLPQAEETVEIVRKLEPGHPALTILETRLREDQPAGPVTSP